MAKLKNWSFRDLKKFLIVYGFTLGHIKGSHYFYNGKIHGEDKVVQVINSNKEKESQSNKTMKMAIKHSGINKNLFEKWKSNKEIDKNIIY